MFYWSCAQWISVMRVMRVMRVLSLNAWYLYSGTEYYNNNSKRKRFKLIHYSSFSICNMFKKIHYYLINIEIFFRNFNSSRYFLKRQLSVSSRTHQQNPIINSNCICICCEHELYMWCMTPRAWKHIDWYLTRGYLWIAVHIHAPEGSLSFWIIPVSKSCFAIRIMVFPFHHALFCCTIHIIW